MMDGDDFYKRATQLLSGTSAAELRSATSRAYYGAFHKARELLSAIGIALPTGPECHTKVCFILGNADDEDVKTASSLLSSLRNARNDADYDLSNPAAESKRSATINVRRADQVIECIGLCLPGGEKDGIHAALREYARNVLRLSVS